MVVDGAAVDCLSHALAVVRDPATRLLLLPSTRQVLVPSEPSSRWTIASNKLSVLGRWKALRCVLWINVRHEIAIS